MRGRTVLSHFLLALSRAGRKVKRKVTVGRTNTHGNVVYGRILLSLPDDEYDAMLPYLEFVEFR
jgi:hypothetical protein